MSKSEAAKVAAKLQGTNGSVWTTEAEGLVEQIGAAVAELAAMGARGGDMPQASAAEDRKTIEKLNAMVTAAERGSLFWRCTTCNADKHQCPGCGASLNHFQAACEKCSSMAAAADAQQEIDELRRERDTLKAANADLSDQLAAAEGADGKADSRVAELERQLKVSDDTIRSLTDLLEAARVELNKERAVAWDRHVDCYVAREVPWSDVAAGMMTIARDGTPWMVESRGYDADSEFVILRNGERTFEKTLADSGETVRVLVPYVTPEAAEELVKSELGGTEVRA